MNILSIQSSVAYGHAGNSSAVFPLQRLGHEVWPVYTVHFSNHTGYGQWRGPVFAPETVQEVIDGIGDRKVLPTCDAVLSGYLGADALGQVMVNAAARVKQENPQAVYCVDPVMGDVGRGFFVAPGIPEFLRDVVVPAADIVTPNQFELEYLTDRKISTLTDLLEAVDSLRANGPRTVLVTSVQTESTPADTVQMAVITDEGAWLVTTPLIDRYCVGTGDATAAIFLAHYLTTTPEKALSFTADAIFSIIETTDRLDSPELAIVAAQDAIASPTNRFEAIHIR